ncbi:sugar transferase [Roseivirga sp.]|uniref:sugar transferase n=1 Tax=Roseivirga sp. TaxID=1964215 RepID=UPI002B27BCFE|nr:sugar transferase [Roseivirga sp.]
MRPSLKVPFVKRAFDITVTGILVLCLAPLFLLVMILIRLESKGPIFYYSYRVGMGYKIFKFYKFRSMRTDADQMVEQLKHLNQYANDNEQALKAKPLTRTIIAYSKHDNILVKDDELFGEAEYEAHKALEDKKAFVKINNDPRITKVGQFIRNTSIDELPQLFNILLGDMSLVGNRPLPLYEAEKLTTDATIGRFLAPAGLTGLWQVTERGKAGMSAESRCDLDIEYALKHNFWLDMKILFKTPLAALQHENV